MPYSLGILIISILITTFVGSAPLTADLLLGILGLRQDALSTTERLTFDIIWNIRLARIANAAVCGACLAGAGVLIQALFRNPLASPSVIGCSAASSLAAALAFYFGFALTSYGALVGAAVAGAFLANGILLFASRVLPGMNRLLLFGVSVSAMFGSLSSLVVSLMLKDHQKAAAALRWMMGSLSGQGWLSAFMGLIALFLASIAMERGFIKLDIYSLGNEMAESMGISTQYLSLLVISLASLLIGTATSIGGAISFVGLIVPHITRHLGGPHHRSLFYCSLINGATLLIWSDTVARTIAAPEEIEVGIITALVGGPFFMWLMLRHREMA